MWLEGNAARVMIPPPYAIAHQLVRQFVYGLGF